MSVALLLDLGNSSLKIALAGKDGFIKTVIVPARNVNRDILARILTEFAEETACEPDTCVACSVVPPLNECLISSVHQVFKKNLLFAPDTLPVPLTIRYEPPNSAGHDRIVEAYAARMLLQAPSLIVIDLGTAVTIDCVEGTTFLGGFILPGPSLALSALNSRTAQLPLLRLDEPPLTFGPGNSTKSCIENGVFFGLICLLEGMVARLKAQLPGPVQVIGCGGFTKRLAENLPIFDTVHTDLVLEGLRLLSTN